MTLALGLLAAALAACALLGWRLLLTSRALHDARVRSTALAHTLDLWQFRTDARHRLVWTLAPATAAGEEPLKTARPTEPTPTALAEQCLWEGCPADDLAMMKAALEQQRPLVDMAVRWAAAQSPFAAGRAGRLRAHAVTDSSGRFAGHVGTWREADEPSLAATTAPATAPDDADDERESFAYTVSHDLRAPIRVVEGFAKILKEDHGRVLDRIGRDHIERILAAAARMNGMIDALLGLSRLSSQPLALQSVDLSKLAGLVGDELRRLWPARTVQLHIEPGMVAEADPTLMRIVLDNLLGNAWKYTGQCPHPEIWFERCADLAGGYVVRDNGAGFDMRFADRLFGAFQRLHSSHDFPGTGVGLASVRRIVRRHGGDVWGTGVVGSGATFQFVLGPPPRR